jgi:hypothetical protein
MIHPDRLRLLFLSLLLWACAPDRQTVTVESVFRPILGSERVGKCTHTVTAPAEMGVVGAVLIASDGSYEADFKGRPEVGSTTILTANSDAPEGECPVVKALDVHLKVLSILNDLSMECSVTSEGTLGWLREKEYQCR